jgi:hypothetical protein
MNTNEYAERARARKSQDLANAFERRIGEVWPAEHGPFNGIKAHCATVVADHARRATLEMWAEVAAQAGIKPPSAATIILATALLSDRARWAATDPFAKIGD